MSWTDVPYGEGRPYCPTCGGFNWAFIGYCMTEECAGKYTDEDYPRSMPLDLKEKEHARASTKAGHKPKVKKAKKVKLPPKGTRRRLELQYEAKGEIAPWLVKDDGEHA